MLFLAFSKTVIQRSNINSAVNIACKFKCYISKSKLVISECIIAFIAFTLHEIKQCPSQKKPGFEDDSVQFFGGTPGIQGRFAFRNLWGDRHFATAFPF